MPSTFNGFSEYPKLKQSPKNVLKRIVLCDIYEKTGDGYHKWKIHNRDWPPELDDAEHDLCEEGLLVMNGGGENTWIEFTDEGRKAVERMIQKREDGES